MVLNVLKYSLLYPSGPGDLLLARDYIALQTSVKVNGAFNASNWDLDKVGRCILFKNWDISASEGCGVMISSHKLYKEP